MSNQSQVIVVDIFNSALIFKDSFFEYLSDQLNKKHKLHLWPKTLKAFYKNNNINLFLDNIRNKCHLNLFYNVNSFISDFVNPLLENNEFNHFGVNKLLIKAIKNVRSKGVKVILAAKISQQASLNLKQYLKKHYFFDDMMVLEKSSIPKTLKLNNYDISQCIVLTKNTYIRKRCNHYNLRSVILKKCDVLNGINIYQALFINNQLAA